MPIAYEFGSINEGTLDQLFGKNSEVACMAKSALARQQPRRGLVPPGETGAAWLDFLTRHGALEGPRGWKDWRAVEWVDALVDWLLSRVIGSPRDARKSVYLKLVKRSIRVAKRDEQFRKAIETTYVLGGQQALVSFVREYDFEGVRPW